MIGDTMLHIINKVMIFLMRSAFDPFGLVDSINIKEKGMRVVLRK